MTLQSVAKGWVGELKTRCTQKLFLDLDEYHIYNNVLIKSGNRTAQIDHVIVSKYGIFVIGTKNKDGWIYGNQRDRQWTQIFPDGTKFKFQNPLRQNFLHTKSLAELLGIDHKKLFSIIVFWGKCEFQTPMPENVLKGRSTDYIMSKRQILLTDKEVNRICSQIQNIKNHTSLLDGWHHSREFKKRFQSTRICPECGGNLLRLISQRKGERFLSCSHYPRCRYKKAL
jgi:restriction system protein